MTISVDLAPEMEAQVAEQARGRGLSIDAYVQEIVARSSRLPVQSPKLSSEELNRLLDEAAEVVPYGLPLSDFAMSRESIYTREDKL